jgi:hypothetical protein
MISKMGDETNSPIELWAFVLVAFSFGIQLSENSRVN